MPRDLTAAVQTAVQAGEGKLTHLMLLNFHDPGTATDDPIRITAASDPLSVDVKDGNGLVSWDAFGGEIEVDPIPESGEIDKAGATLRFPGVDLTIIQKILAKYYIGRDCAIWRVHFSGDTAIDDPIPLFSGSMSGGWKVRERRGRDDSTVTLELRALSDLAMLDEANPVRHNVDSYRRAFPEFAEDSFYDVVPQNARKQEPWGKRALED